MAMIWLRALLPLPALALSIAALAQAPIATADTTAAPPAPFFTRSDALVAGGLAIGTVAMFPLDRNIARYVRGDRLQRNAFLVTGASIFRVAGVPGSLIIGPSLYVVGRLGRQRRMADLGLHGTEAVVLGGGSTFMIKGLVGRSRPFVTRDQQAHDFRFGRGFAKGDAYSSFPSGHAAAAFAAAAAVTAETRRWSPGSIVYVAPVMYGGATLVGLSRLYNDKHWASDVVMGAAVGIFSGVKVVQYTHRNPNNPVDRRLLPTAIVPDGRGGVVLAWMWRT